MLELVILNASNIMISRKKKVETATSCSMFIHVLHVSCCHFLCHQRHHDFVSWHLRGLSHGLFGAEGREILGHAHAEPQQWRGEALLNLRLHWEILRWEEDLSRCCDEFWKFCRDDG